MKTCVKCHKKKNQTSFSPIEKGENPKRNNVCKTCSATAMRAYYKTATGKKAILKANKNWAIKKIKSL